MNPSLIVDLDFITPIDYKQIRSDKHARIIKSMMDRLNEFRHLYETSQDWKLINQVEKFNVYKRSSEDPRRVIILAKGEMDHQAKSIVEYAFDVKHVSNYDKTISWIQLLETLPENGQILYCHAHKFLTTEQCEMYLAQIVIHLKDGTTIIPTISTTEYAKEGQIPLLNA